MKHKILIFIFLFLISSLASAQIPLGCQSETDATIGIDRKNWNGGSTSSHSEGYMMNFTLPNNTFGPCQKITQVQITFTINSFDLSGLPVDCSISNYWTNIYTGCGSFAPASCDVSNIVAEFPNGMPTSQVLTYNCPPENFDFGDILGIDLIPAVDNVGCTNGQSMISSGQVSIDYDVCVEITVGDDDIDMPVVLGTDLMVCENETVQIDAGSGFAQYNWNPNGQITQMITVGAGTYVVTVTDANGCTDSDDITITESIPSVNITSNDADNVICVDDLVSLTANTTQSNIIWDPNGQVTATIMEGPGTYTVTVTDANLCTATDQIIIDAWPQPSVTLSPSAASVCAGETVNVAATPGFVNYDWGGGLFGQTVDLPSGMFTLTITDGNGCTDEESINIQSVPAPNAGTDNSLNACNDGQLFNMDMLLGVHDPTGFWTDLDVSGVDVNVNPTATSFIGLTPGSYNFSYTVTGNSPCVDDVAFISVTIFNGPNAGINNSTVVCNDGSLVDLDALIGLHDLMGIWSDDNGAGVDLSDPFNVNFLNVPIGVYNFTYTVVGISPCNDATSTVQVSVESGANAGDDNSLSICEGSVFDLNLALTPGTPTTGTWNDDDGTGALSGSMFNTSGFANQTLNFTYSVGSAFCGSDDALISIDVVTSVSAGNDNLNNDFCFTDADNINLFDYIPTADIGGTFTDLDLSGALQNNTVIGSLLSSGTFQFEYSVGDGVVCPLETSIIEFNFFESPTFTMADGHSFCNNDCVDVNINFTGTPSFTYSFDVYSGDDNITDLYLNTTSDLNTILTVCNDGGNGTISGDTLHIGDAFDLWYLYPSAIGDLNCNIDLVGISDTLFFEIADSYNVLINDMLCANESITVNNTVYDINNPTDVVVVQNANDCDSIYTIDLSFFAVSDTLIDTQLCQGDSLEINGVFYNEINSTGTEIIMAGSQNQCDSIINIDLNFVLSIETFPSEIICLGDSIFLEGAWQTVAGVYVDMLTSSNGCDSIVTTTLSIDPCMSGIDVLLTHNPCFGDNVGEISISVDGGAAPFEVDWMGNGLSGSFTLSMINEQGGITGLFSETYTFTITDANGDILQILPLTIVDNSAEITGQINVLSEISCFEESDASIEAEVNGGSGNFDFEWNPTLSNAAIQNNLGPGIYQVTATDEFDCTIELTQEIFAPAEISYDFMAIDISCDSQNGGEVSITNIVGGNMPYQVFVDGVLISPTNSTNNLLAGMHDISVVDANNCSRDTTFNITADDAISFDFDVIELPCDGSALGSVTVSNIQGGTGQYEVFVDGVLLGPTLMQDNLDAGVHEIIIRDTDMCEVGTQFTIQDAAMISFDAFVNDATCGMDNGFIVLNSINTGNIPYEIFLNGVLQSSGTMSDLSPDNYTIMIIDENDCQKDTTVMLGSDTPIMVDYDFTNIDCLGNLGTFILNNVSGGTAPFQLTLDGIAINEGVQVNDLAAGLHDLAVLDSNDCLFEDSFQIEADLSLTVDYNTENASCDNAEDGTISINNISGGTMPYTVFVNGVEATNPNLIMNLGVGDVSIVIMDANNCEFMELVTIDADPSPSLLDYTMTYSIMEGDSILLEGNFLSNVDSISWESNPTLSCLDCANPMAGPIDFTNYVLTVWDENGCSDQVLISVEVEQIPEFELYVSNAFSPNGDGLNDHFDVLSGLDSDIVIETYDIYDRWGNLIFSGPIQIGQDNGWDGLINNRKAMPGIYAYFIQYRNGPGGELKSKAGDLSLMR